MAYAVVLTFTAAWRWYFRPVWSKDGIESGEGSWCVVSGVGVGVVFNTGGLVGSVVFPVDP
jgi:4-amino-4-deoxy-L-arabinose transferase-like glycosyltransferase